MSPRTRATLALGLLAAFGALLGCGQRGPLTLPGSARPIERLDPSKAAPAAPAAGAEAPADAASAAAAPADAAPQAEDEERRKAQ